VAGMSDNKIAYAVAFVLALVVTVLVGTLSQVGMDRSREQTVAAQELLDKDSIIDQLEAKVNNLTYTIGDLNAKTDYLTKIIEFNMTNNWSPGASDPIVYQPHSNSTIAACTINYAGYLVVTVNQSTSDKIWIQVKFADSHGVSYDNKVYLNEGEKASFPMLPSTIYVFIGNDEPTSEASVKLTAILYY
jgi:hypothetical protein